MKIRVYTNNERGKKVSQRYHRLLDKIFRYEVKKYDLLKEKDDIISVAAGLESIIDAAGMNTLSFGVTSENCKKLLPAAMSKYSVSAFKRIVKRPSAFTYYIDDWGYLCGETFAFWRNCYFVYRIED